MPSPSLVALASTLDELVEANSCPIGRYNLFKFRHRLDTSVVVPILGFNVPYPDCFVVVEILRSSCSDLNFQYGSVHEFIIYSYTNGVGSFAGTTSPYTFNGGAGMIYTRTDTFTPAMGDFPPYLSIGYSQPEVGLAAYLAGYGRYYLIPSSIIPVRPFPPRPTPELYAVSQAFSNESLSTPFNLYPYQRYNTFTTIPLANTNYRGTPDIPLDVANVDNSALIICLTAQGVASLSSTQATFKTYYTFQGGSSTVPPYTMILRNTTTVTTTPNVLNNSMVLTATPVLVTGSPATPPAVYFNLLATNVPSPCTVFLKVEVVCSAHDPINYS
jgi:hypothetical protein